jgi:hypothetical protein
MVTIVTHWTCSLGTASCRRLVPGRLRHLVLPGRTVVCVASEALMGMLRFCLQCWLGISPKSWYNVYTTLSWQFPTQTRAGRVAEVVECFPRKGEALNSHPCTLNKKEINKKSASHSRVQPHCRSNIFRIIELSIPWVSYSITCKCCFIWAHIL